MSQFKSVRWGDLGIGTAPNYMFPDGKLALSGKAVTVLLALIHAYRYAPTRDDQPERATVYLRQYPDTKKQPTGASLGERTGLNRRDISRAITELDHLHYVQRIENLDREERSKKGHLLCNGYVLSNPATGRALRACPESNVLYGNGLRYFTFPKVLFTQPDKHWSLANLSSSEVKAYMAVCFMAGKRRQNAFSCNLGELADCSNLGEQTLNRALANLVDERGLIYTDDVSSDAGLVKRSNKVTIELCDPFTGIPLPVVEDDEENPQNYLVGGTRRADLNFPRGDTDALLKRIQSWGYTGEVIWQGNGDLKISCPLPQHCDSTPSLSVSADKEGSWKCFGCNRTGSIFDLMRAFRDSGQSNIQLKESKAEARYQYRDGGGRLLKVVERLPGKRFRQCVPFKGDWLYQTSDLKSMLYNAHRLRFADTVCVCEGEKDCDRVTDLQLTGICMPIVAVTSGGADSWDPKLAKQLKGKQVMIVPDNDEAGRRHADEVEKSLRAEGIDYKRVGFASTDCKDVSDFIERNGKEKFEELLEANWVRLEDGSWIIQEPILMMASDAIGEWMDEEIRV